MPGWVYKYSVVVIGGLWGQRVGAGGQLDSQLEEVNLNFLLSSNGHHPYALHLPLTPLLFCGPPGAQ